jgi:DNA-binding MarR family transcriptional regulator
MMTGLWISSQLLAKDISHAERMVLAFIAGFPDGYFGSDKYIADCLHMNQRTVERVVSSLYKSNLLVRRDNKRFCVS